MYKYKKMTLFLTTIIYIICFILELVSYFRVDTTLFGVFYLLMNLVIIFLLIPVTYNYKKYFSKARISKLILIIVFGIFSSYILEHIILGCMSFVDSSYIYIKSIGIYKNFIKGLIYVLLIWFTVLEYKLDKLILNLNVKNDKKRP